MSNSTVELSLDRAKKVYKYFFIATTLIVLFVFFEPTLNRLAEGEWIRGRFHYVWTLSLDIHAVFGYLFVMLVMVQVFMGYRQKSKPNLTPFHRKLGKLLFYIIIPAFALTGAWVSIERSTTIPPELSVIFRRDRMMGRIALFQLLVFFLWYAVRSLRAIKRRDVPSHLDAILGAFVLASGIAVIRFLYFLFWATRGGAPFSVVGMYLITVFIMCVQLGVAYRLAGRFQQNKMPLFCLAAVTILYAVLGANHYDFMDVE